MVTELHANVSRFHQFPMKILDPVSASALQNMIVTPYYVKWESIPKNKL